MYICRVYGSIVSAVWPSQDQAPKYTHYSLMPTAKYSQTFMLYVRTVPLILYFYGVLLVSKVAVDGIHSRHDIHKNFHTVRSYSVQNRNWPYHYSPTHTPCSREVPSQSVHTPTS